MGIAYKLWLCGVHECKKLFTLLLARVNVGSVSGCCTHDVFKSTNSGNVSSYLTVKSEEDGNYPGSDFGVIVGIVREKWPDSSVMRIFTF